MGRGGVGDHEGEGHGDGVDVLDDEEGAQGRHLDEREGVDALHSHDPQPRVVCNLPCPSGAGQMERGRPGWYF